MLNSPFKPRKNKDFRILLFYPNLHMSALMPQSMGIFTALFKREGFTLDLFDCTYYLDADIEEAGIGKNTNEEKVKNRNVKRFDNKVWQGKGIAPKTGIEEDFKNAVKGIIRLPKNSKFAVYIAYRYYFKLLKKLKRISSENIVKKRVRIHNFQKFVVIARSYVKYQLNLIQWI